MKILTVTGSFGIDETETTQSKIESIISDKLKKLGSSPFPSSTELK